MHSSQYSYQLEVVYCAITYLAITLDISLKFHQSAKLQSNVCQTSNFTALPLVYQLVIVLPHQVSTDVGLEQAHDLCESIITLVLKLTQDSCPEEHLGVPNLVDICIKLEGFEDILCYHFAIHKACRDGIGGQDRVSVEWQMKS